jgi:hypothetical protein
MRDFLYVSERKIDRIAQTLPPHVARRLKELNFKAGPVGAGLVLADARADTAVAAVAEIEKAIHREHTVRHLTDPELASGNWFSADALDMTYGVQVAHSASGSGAALFMAQLPGLHLLLSGSAEYLLDRPVPRADAGGGMSDPQAITDLLRAVAEDSSPDDSAQALTSRVFTSFDDAAAYAEGNLLQLFSDSVIQPLSFLARAIKIVKSDQNPGATLILGTPLFVAFAQ